MNTYVSILKETVGLDLGNSVVRNWIYAEPCSDIWEECEELVHLGFLAKTGVENKYMATAEGVKFIQSRNERD